MPPRSLPLVALVLALGTLIATARIVAGGETWSDVRYHTEVAPPRLAAAAQVQAGALPAWWDGTGLGVPLAGEPSHGAMAPALWLAGSPRALDLILVMHLFVLALGVAVWARRTTGEPAAIVAGLLAITTGVVASTAVRGALPALAWLPWLGAAASTLRGGAPGTGDRRAAVAIAAMLGLVGLGGQLALLVDGVAIAIAFGDRRATRAWLAAAIGLGLLISLAQWLPTLLALPAMAGATVTSLPLSRLVELVVPGSFGSADPDRGLAAIAGLSAWAPSLYLGVPLLALAAVTPVSRRQIGLAVGLALLALVVGRGGWPAWLGAPELHVAALGMVLAPFAAEGVEALVAGARRARLALIAGGACALVALVALVVFRTSHDEAHAAIDRALVDGVLGVACIAGALALATRLQPVALALLVAPGFGAGHAVSPTTSRADMPRWAELARDEVPPRRLYRPEGLHEGPEAPERRYFETYDDAITTLAGASADRWGIDAARSDDPARSRLHDRAWAAAARGGGVLLDRFGIGLAILPSVIVGSRGMTELATRGRWTLAELPAAPVASVMSGARYQLDPDRALGLMFTADGRAGMPRGTVVIMGTGDSMESALPPKPCHVDRWDPGDLALACVADRAGVAVVSSGAAPGWSVTVDGVDAEPLEADVLRRAVAVTAGPHAIAWRYRAPGLRAGIACLLLGLAALIPLYMRSRASRASS